MIVLIFGSHWPTVFCIWLRSPLIHNPVHTWSCISDEKWNPEESHSLTWSPPSGPDPNPAIKIACGENYGPISWDKLEPRKNFDRKNVRRLMSDKLLSYDRRGNLIQRGGAEARFETPFRQCQKQGNISSYVIKITATFSVKLVKNSWQITAQ